MRFLVINDTVMRFFGVKQDFFLL